MSDTPEFDGLLEKYAAEESEALIAYQVHDMTTGVEELLIEAAPIDGHRQIEAAITRSMVQGDDTSALDFEWAGVLDDWEASEG